MHYRYNEVGVVRTILGWVLLATAGMQLRDSLETNVQGLQLFPDDALRHALPGFFTRRRTQQSFR